MSVTNRKMFRRDARNKLRNMGGIMASSEPLIQAVAKFNPGGSVRKPSMLELMFQPPVTLNTVPGLVQKVKQIQNEGGGPPYATAVNPQRTFMGVKLPDFIKTDSDISNNMPNYNILGGGANINLLPTVAETGETFTQSLDKTDPESDTIAGRFKKGLIGFGDYVKENPAEAASFLGLSILPGALVYKGVKYAPSMFGALKNILFGSKVRTAGTLSAAGGASYVGQDEINEFIKEGGLSRLYESGKKQLEKLPETVKEGKKRLDEALGIEGPKGKALREREESERARAIAGGQPTDITSKDIQEVLKAARAKDLQELRGPGGTEARLADMTGGRRGTLETDELFKKDLQDEISGGRISSETPQTLGVTADQGEEAKANKATTDYVEGEGSKADIKAGVTRVVSSGVGTGGALKQLIKEFTDNAPEYKGMDKGLAIAKIGFAMAAGQSPNAVTNIANALSQGADMFIEDDAKRDAFNRQVQLSALQYGLGEVAKQRAQGRADARNFDTYVVGKGGYTAPDGTKFEEGQMVELSMAERLKNADKMQNLASLTALKERKEFQLKEMEIKTAQLELLKAASGNKIFEEGVGVSDFQKMKGDYVDLIGKAEDATRAKAVFQEVYKLVDDPETSPFRSGFKGFFGQRAGEIGTFFGIEVDRKFLTRQAIEEKALGAMGDITSVVLGKTQSANSISDRDVLFNILRPFFGNLIKQEADGRFSIDLTQKSLVLDQINRAVARLDDAQVQALRTADGIYESFGSMPKVKGTTGSALDLLGDVAKERRQAFGKLGSELEFDVTYDGDVATGLSLREKS
tara:strand:- start:3304 stop:5727 length:2424 start_codon:yes stop_codon:yes gene_type:complete